VAPVVVVHPVAHAARGGCRLRVDEAAAARLHVLDELELEEAASELAVQLAA